MATEPAYAWMTSLRLRHQLAKEFVAELLGTFILMLFGNAAGAIFTLGDKPTDTFAATWSWGVGVMMGIVASGGMSGGHINPAVTLAFATLRKFPWKKVPVYILAQHIGSFLSSCVLYITYLDALRNTYDLNITTPLDTAKIWATYPQPFLSLHSAVLDQVVATGVIMFTVMAISDEKNMKVPKYLQPMFAGFMVCCVAMAFGFNCMAPLNPARDLAPRIFTSIAGWGAAPFEVMYYQYWWLGGVVGPHLGAIVGGWLYYICIELQWGDDDDIIITSGVPHESTKTISSFINESSSSFVGGQDKNSKDINEMRMWKSKVDVEKF